MGDQSLCDCSGIMGATFEAMSVHGYADLTIEKIAERYGKQKSNIYYHYDDKQQLMEQFLDHLIAHLKEEMGESEDLDPEEKLELFLEKALAIEDQRMWEFRKSILEMKAHAPYNSEFSEKFGEIYELLQEHLKTIFSDMEEEKPGEKADIVLSTVDGAVERSISTGDRESVKDVKESLLSII